MNKHYLENENSLHQVSLKDVILKFREWVKYLKSKLVVLIILGAIGAIIGYLYANYKKTLYVSKTTFVLEDAQGGSALGAYAGIASTVGIDLGSGGGVFEGDNILELYRSRKMIQKTLFTKVSQNNSNISLLDSYISFNEVKKKWAEDSNFKKYDIKSLGANELKALPSRLLDSVLGVIVKDINKNYLVVNKPDKKLNIIEVEVKASNEVFAKSFNDEIVKNVNDFYKQTKVKKSLDNVKILQFKTDSVRNVMNGSIYSAASIADATPNLNPTRQVQRTAPVQRYQFSAETNKSMLSELVRNLELAKISLKKEEPLIQVIDEPIYPLETLKISKFKATIIGGVLSFFLTVLVLILRKIYLELIR